MIPAIQQGNSFSSFGSSLADSTRRAARAFGLQGGVKPWRIIAMIAGALFGFWMTWKVFGWWQS
jgi:blocked-early-in-transport protein 1